MKQPNGDQFLVEVEPMQEAGHLGHVFEKEAPVRGATIGTVGSGGQVEDIAEEL